MSSNPEPPEDPELPQGVRLLSRPFWILMVLAAMCLAAATVVGFAGPRLFPKAPLSASHPTAPLASAPRNGRETP